MMKSIDVLAIGALLVALVAATACAQRRPYPNRDFCDRAVATVNRGKDSLDAAHWNLVECGPRGAAALASRWSAIKSWANSKQLASLAGATGAMKDAHLFNTVVDVLTDRAASEPSRVHALLAVILMVNPNTAMTVEHLSGPEVRCLGAGVKSHSYQYEISPLPNNYPERLLQLVERVSNDESEPLVLRRAMRCLEMHTKASIRS